MCLYRLIKIEIRISLINMSSYHLSSRIRMIGRQSSAGKSMMKAIKLEKILNKQSIYICGTLLP